MTTSSAQALEFEVIARWQTDNQTLTPITLDGDIAYVAGETTIEAWQVSSRRRLWRTPLPSPASFRPRLADDDTVISAGRDHLMAWNRADGRLRWRYTNTKEIGVPHVTHGGVYFGEGGELVALATESGAERWRFPITGNARIHYAPISDAKHLYLGAGDGVLYALEPESGRVIWRVDREKDWQYLRQLYLSDGTIVAGGYKDEVFGLNAKNGTQAWRFYAGNFINSQHVDQGSVYFWSPTGWLYAFDAKRGERLWRHRTNKYKRSSKREWAPLMAELKTAGEYLLALDMKHVLHVLNRQTGDETATLRLPFRARPFVSVVSNARQLLFGTLDGEVVLARLRE
ncbi:MAG: PQQ-like beta-propeller repeat protein [Rhodospirillaceae bacterium]|nr:PQQ-like beta-propeller repeat protein [Rhodospirillaceae bacterium]